MNSTIKKTTLFLGACMAFQLGGIPQMFKALKLLLDCIIGSCKQER